MGNSVTRLYQQFQPEHYDLIIAPDAETMHFTGSVTIRGQKVGRPSQRITVHGKGLKISAATITRHDKKGDQSFELTRLNIQKSYDEIRLHTTQMLYPGNYTITLDFNGTFARSLSGMYPYFFQYEGKEHIGLMTQFESHYAREVFPCIDEPEAKATFQLSLVTPKNLTVLSNTPIAEQRQATNYERLGRITKNKAKEAKAPDVYLLTRFEVTPRMSTYLLAWVIGELHSKSTKTKNGTEVSVWTTIAQPLEAVDFALDIAKRSIEYFEDYFGVPYPLAKADHVAVPDFSAGAMENWGLITYRERTLLVYPGETAQSSKEYVSEVIAHETSHQWFGNLVTMKWWDNLWLNESFANMMEYQAPDTMYPEWKLWNIFIAQDGLSALRRDATPGVQAVQSEVKHPDEISTLFDPSIVYAKGGRLLYMLKSYIGGDAFRTGLSNYFKKHAYGNTTSDDLWAALSEASGVDVGAFMNPWLQQPGFPVLTIEQVGSQLAISQEHFSDNRDKADPSRLWPVPLFADTEALPKRQDERTQNYAIPDNRFVQLDTSARGHYVVNYATDQQRQELIRRIKANKLSDVERLMLLNDNSMLAKAGYRNYGDVLGLLAAYHDESSESVWDMIALIIAETRRFIDHDEALEAPLKQYVRSIIAKEHKRLGWEDIAGESSADHKLRATIIGLGAYAEESSIIKRSLELFAAYKAGTATLPPELRSIIMGVPVKLGQLDAVEYLLHLHDTTRSNELQSDICGALTITRSKSEALRLLDRLTNPKLVKPQDADRWLIYLLRNRYVKYIAWEWMERHWSWIEETYKSDKSYDMFPRYAATTCSTREWADIYGKFFEPKEDIVALRRNILMGKEEIASRVAWLERDLISVKTFFSKKS